MIGKNVSNGWIISAGFLWLEKVFGTFWGNKWNNGDNKAGGEHGMSVNYDGCQQWGFIEKHENRFADIEKREGGGWGAGEKKVNAALTRKREKGLA